MKNAVEIGYYKEYGELYFKINYQHVVCTDVRVMTPCGIQVIDVECPEWRPNENKLFLNGCGRWRRARCTVVQSFEEVILINKAIKQFNHIMRPKLK